MKKGYWKGWINFSFQDQTSLRKPTLLFTIWCDVASQVLIELMLKWANFNRRMFFKTLPTTNVPKFSLSLLSHYSCFNWYFRFLDFQVLLIFIGCQIKVNKPSVFLFFFFFFFFFFYCNIYKYIWTCINCKALTFNLKSKQIIISLDDDHDHVLFLWKSWGRKCSW